jgi:tetratricopeptide (TPR) repeat protein
MNLIKISWLVVLVALFNSCRSDYTENKTILKAEKILDTSPDSAYSLLISIKQPEKLSKADYAAWCLQYTYALDRLHKEIKSDSLIQIAISYYSSGNLAKYSGTAWYLLGSTYSSQNQKAKAIFAFKKAEDILEGTNENKLKGLIAFNIGYTDMQDQLYSHSLNYFRESLKYFELAGDNKRKAYAYREIGNMYHQLNYPFDSISHYLDMAARLSKEVGDSINYYSILVRQGQILLEKDNYQSKEYILKAYEHFPESKPYNAAYLAKAYSGLDIQDSALYYLRISLADTSNTPYRIIGLHAAALIFRSKGDYKAAYYYLDKAHTLRDSTYQQNMRSQLYRIDRQYNVAQKEQENAQLKLYNRNMAIWIALLMIVVLTTVIIFLLINSQHKRKHAINATEKQRLKYESETTQIRNAQKRALLDIRLHNKIDNTLKFNKFKRGYQQKEKIEAFIQDVARQSIIAEKKWAGYVDEVDELFENGITKMKGEYQDLTIADLIVIALISLQVNITDACNLLDMTKNTMYTRRGTIKKRLKLNEDTNLEKWISDYLPKEIVGTE